MCKTCGKALSPSKRTHSALFCSNPCQRIWKAKEEIKQAKALNDELRIMRDKAMKLAQTFDTLEKYASQTMEQMKEYVVFKETVGELPADGAL